MEYSLAQKNAFDFIIVDESGKPFKTDGKAHEDYYAFGKELISPCDGIIIKAADGIDDNVPGIENMNPAYPFGNYVVI